MKRIPPAIQEDHRYLKFKVQGDRKELGEVVDAVWDSATEYMGVQGVSSCDLWIIGNKFDEEAQTGVIKVNSKYEDDLRAALTLKNGFGDDTFLSVENVSGTLKKL